MNKRHIFEAERLLRHASEINPDAVALAVKALNELASADSQMPILRALIYINSALPSAALSEKERELL